MGSRRIPRSQLLAVADAIARATASAILAVPDSDAADQLAVAELVIRRLVENHDRLGELATGTPDTGPTDPYTASVLLSVGRGLGFAHAHDLLRPGALEEGDLVARVLDVAAALDSEGDPHAAKAMRGAVADVRAAVNRQPAIDAPDAAAALIDGARRELDRPR